MTELASTEQSLAEESSLLTRQSLPKEIVTSLLLGRDHWEKNPQIRRRSQIFFDYHQFLSGASLQLANSLENLLDYANIQTVNASSALEIDRNIKTLLQHTHHHHDIEDMHYFPQLKQQFPQIRRGIELLDNDHKELMVTLNAIDAIDLKSTTDSNRYDSFARLYGEIAKLAKIFPRHFHDEEDLIVPALGMGSY